MRWRRTRDVRLADTRRAAGRLVHGLPGAHPPGWRSDHEGELSVELDGDFQTAGPGSAVFLPRQRSHAFVITSPVARYVTLHTPADFDALLLASGTVAVPGVDAPPTEAADLAELARIAREHSIEILGPPPSLEEALGPPPRT